MRFMILAFVLALVGCTSLNSYSSKTQELNTAYAEGKLTYAEYMTLKQNIYAQEYRERQDAAASVEASFNSAIQHNQEAFDIQKKIAGMDKPAWDN